LPAWAGELPLALVPQAPVPDAHVPPGTDTPAYLTRYRRR
jgi:hypothetical protein